MNAWDIFKIFFILLIITLVMYGVLFWIKKYFYSYDKNGNSSSSVQVLSTQTILPKKFVSVIRFNNSIYLLGISEQSLNLIDKIEEYNFEKPVEKNLQNKPNFLSLLKKNMGFK